MALLQEKDRQYLIEHFQSLTTPVKILVFTQEMECQYCKETRMIAEEVAELSEAISVEAYDFVADKATADQYHIDKIPALVIMRGGEQPKDYSIRYYGVPSGYEFTSVIEDIMMVSSGESGLSEATRKELATLEKHLHFQVFVTPTCPYCPQAVRLANQMAMESDLVRGDMIEAIEFPHLSQKYQVQGVPRTVINEDVHQEGAAPEAMLMQRVREALR